jgi:predicted DNA binding CopG/RHH family protein
MSKQKLSSEERDILNDFEKGDFKSQLSPKRIEQLKAAAEETFKKDRRINIRISSRDLEGLQRRALEEGVPYQTLVSSILHKYVSGSLQDIAANKSRKKDAPGRASS